MGYLMSDALPPFFPVSEACMASLASRPEEWKVWTLEDFEFLTLSYREGRSGRGVLHRKRRSLLSVLPEALKSARWRAKFLSERSSPSASVSRLLAEESYVTHKSQWLRFVRGQSFQDNLNTLYKDLDVFLGGRGLSDWRLELRLLKRSYKDSRGRFEEGQEILKIKIWVSSEIFFKGSVEELAKHFCI